MCKLSRPYGKSPRQRGRSPRQKGESPRQRGESPRQQAPQLALPLSIAGKPYRPRIKSKWYRNATTREKVYPGLTAWANRLLRDAATPKIKPDWVPVYGQPKHLYIFPLRQKWATIARKRNWQSLSYPKPSAARLLDAPVPTGASKARTLGAAPNLQAAS